MIIALVESPLQLLNAFEAAAFFCRKKKVHYLVRLSGEPHNDAQLSHLIDRLAIDKVLMVTVPVEKVGVSTLIKIVCLKVLFFLSMPIYKKIIIGNYDSSFIRVMIGKVFNDKRKLLLVDDGAKTLSQQAAFNADDNRDFFSMYELEAHKNQQIYRNQYPALKEMLSYQKIKTCAKTVLFLGSKLSEASLISESQYIAYLEQIQAYYKAEGLRVVYVPHRGENAQKLDAIRQHFDFDFTELNYPIELIGLYQDKLPKKVASFYSTALYSLNAIYGLEVDCFEFEYSTSSHQLAIKAVYDLYRNHYHMVDLRPANKSS